MFLLASFLTHWIPLNKLFCFDETFVLKICLLTFKTREKNRSKVELNFTCIRVIKHIFQIVVIDLMKLSSF